MTNLRAEILDAVAVVRRRRWLALSIAWLICCVGWGVVTILPNEYASETRLYVDTDSLLGPLLRNLAIENDLARQVQVMQRTLLSRPNLRQVIASTNLSLKARSSVDEQNLFDKLEASTLIRAQGPNLFTISYFDSNPVLARDVVQAFITILMENSAGQNRTDMEKARSFIERQIATYEQKLKEIESRMADFQKRHVEELGSVGTNFSGRLEAVGQASAATRREYEDALVRRDSLATQLAGIPKQIEIQTAPQVVVNQQQVNPLQVRIVELRNSLATLRQRYTDRHPDVLATKRALDELLEQAKADGVGAEVPVAPPAAGKTRVSNPVYEQAQMRFVDAQQAVELAKRHLAQAQSEERRLVALAGSAPVIENEYNDLSREYGVQKKQYEELLERRESARISEAVQNSANRIQFRIIESPNIPVRPSGPKRVLFLSVILGFGVVAGIGAAFLANRIQDPVTSKEGMVKRFGLPVIGEISIVDTAGSLFVRRRQALITALSLLTLFAIFGTLLGFSAARGGGYQVEALAPFTEWLRGAASFLIDLKGF